MRWFCCVWRQWIERETFPWQFLNNPNGMVYNNFRPDALQFAKKYCNSQIWLLFYSRDFFSISSSATSLVHSVKTGWPSIIILNQISAKIYPVCVKFFSRCGSIASPCKFRWNPHLSWDSIISILTKFLTKFNHSNLCSIKCTSSWGVPC